MLNRQRQVKTKQWYRGGYAPNVIIRFLLLFVLWVFYGLIPHQLDSIWLFLVTGIMVAHSVELYRNNAKLMFPLMIVAAFLNTMLIFLLPMDAQSMYPLTLPPILLIYLILLIDIVLFRETCL